MFLVSKNKKGQVIFYAFMIGITILVLALALAPPVRTQVDEARTAMDCGNESISNFYKAACVVSDLTIFYFIGGLIFIAGAVITAKIILT